MGVFKRRYEDLRHKRSTISNQGLGETYKRVIEEYNQCMEIEEYIVSFILIQNLLEDRLYVLYKMMDTMRRKREGSDIDLSLEYYHERIDLKNVIYDLQEGGLLTEELKKDLILSVNIRNKHIHFSFMDVDSFDKELSESFYTLFREIDRIIQKLKTLI